MSIREVVAVPDAILSTRAHEVTQFDSSLRVLVEDLLDTMAHSPGCVGLAAVQIGCSLRVFVVDVSSHKKTKTCHGRLVAVNPEINNMTRPRKVREGCLSVPDFTGGIIRYENVEMYAFDVYGEPFSISTDAFESQAIQHEVDHLDGMVFLDRVVDVDDVFARKRYL